MQHQRDGLTEETFLLEDFLTSVPQFSCIDPGRSAKPLFASWKHGRVACLGYCVRVPSSCWETAMMERKLQFLGTDSSIPLEALITAETWGKCRPSLETLFPGIVANSKDNVLHQCLYQRRCVSPQAPRSRVV